MILGSEVMQSIHSVGLGDGLAGGINKALNYIPLVGPTLAEGGIWSMVATGIIGIGGTLLGKHMEHDAQTEAARKLGKWIRYGALATSLLIAMPSILTGISVGITFLSQFFTTSVDTISTVMTNMKGSLGAMGSMTALTPTTNLLSISLPHLLTCGMAIIPTALAIFMGTPPKKEAAPEPVEEKHGWQARIAEAKEKPAAISASL